MRILFIESNVSDTQNLPLFLENAGIVVDVSGTGKKAFSLIKKYKYDVFLLDLMLSDMDGYEVLFHLRSIYKDMPILVLSNLLYSQAKVRAFTLGADDFIAKPFDEAELLARVQAVVRRSKRFPQASLTVGLVTLNLLNREVTVNGQLTSLTDKEYSILELLILRRGTVQTREAIISYVYGDNDYADPKVIDVVVSHLRKKLSNLGEANLINTVWGRGYIINEALSSDNILQNKSSNDFGYDQSTRSTRVLSAGLLRCNIDSKEVTIHDRPIHLTGKEYSTLEILITNKNKPINKEDIYGHLYDGEDKPELKIVDVFVAKLRKKLVQAGADNLIGLVWEQGYTMNENILPFDTLSQSSSNKEYKLDNNFFSQSIHTLLKNTYPSFLEKNSKNLFSNEENLFLEILLSHKGNVVSKNLILEQIHNNALNISVDNIDVIFSKIQEKLSSLDMGALIEAKTWVQGYIMRDHITDPDSRFNNEKYQSLISPTRALDVLLGRTIDDSVSELNTTFSHKSAKK